MRRRSTTLYAENIEEYTMKALAPSNQSYGVPGPIRRSNSKKKLASFLPQLLKEDTIKDISDQSQMTLNTQEDFPSCIKMEDNDWSEFDFDEDGLSSQNKKDNSFTNENQQIEQDACSTDDTDLCSTLNIGKFVTRKFMIIGSHGTGRHSLINSIFESQGKEGQSSVRQTMDLIIKTRKEIGTEIKYQFWMKALNDNRFDGLIKVYYRNASIFVFIYSIIDKHSFEMLDEAIQSVLKEVPQEKFVGILVGNKSDLERQRKVSFSEGMCLKEKYNLSLFLETHLNEQTSKDKLFSFLNN